MSHERLGPGPFRHRKITYNLCFSFTYGKCQRIDDKVQLALQHERFKIGSGLLQARQDAHDLAATVAIERVLGPVMGFDLGDVTDFEFPGSHLGVVYLWRRWRVTADSSPNPSSLPGPGAKSRQNDLPDFVSYNLMVVVSSRTYSGCLANSHILNEIGSPTATMWTKNPETRSW